MAISESLEDSFFGNLEVGEHDCDDGLYRYTTGSYRTFSDARRRLLQIREQGYPDAFIQTREWLENAAR